MLLERGIVKNMLAGLKVLGEGELAKPVSVSAHQFSQSARDKILKAGGKVEVLA
ncbi:50S ribosomal protein L15 [compost metagenome]